MAREARKMRIKNGSSRSFWLRTDGVELAPRSPRGHMAGSLRKPAKSGVGRLSSLRGCACAVYSACALTFAGMNRLSRSFFCPSGRDPRGFRGQPLGDHRRPRPFLPWESTLNVRTMEILHLCSISSGPTADGTSSISPFARWINRAFTMLSGSESKWLAQRRRCSGSC